MWDKKQDFYVFLNLFPLKKVVRNLIPAWALPAHSHIGVTPRPLFPFSLSLQPLLRDVEGENPVKRGNWELFVREKNTWSDSLQKIFYLLLLSTSLYFSFNTSRYIYLRISLSDTHTHTHKCSVVMQGKEGIKPSF